MYDLRTRGAQRGRGPRRFRQPRAVGRFSQVTLGKRFPLLTRRSEAAEECHEIVAPIAVAAPSSMSSLILPTSGFAQGYPPRSPDLAPFRGAPRLSAGGGTKNGVRIHPERRDLWQGGSAHRALPRDGSTDRDGHLLVDRGSGRVGSVDGSEPETGPVLRSLDRVHPASENSVMVARTCAGTPGHPLAASSIRTSWSVGVLSVQVAQSSRWSRRENDVRHPADVVFPGTGG
jgi:hypothetical protein